MIRPVELHGMVQSTQDVSTMKHNENQRPVVEQQAMQLQHEKQLMHQAKQVKNKEDTQREDNKHDARKKGKNEYIAIKKRKGKNAKTQVAEEGFFAEHESFDIQV
ncbi:hypothetical protein FACS1894111_02700 [Clostridia bacterium]|nr:hypothetical protein FACS1894111_02700 [Clostridia bacterium]